MLQHSCGSGQRGPADPAGEVGQRGRAVPGLCPRGGGNSALSKSAGAELSSPDAPSSILCSSCSAAHKAPLPRHPERPAPSEPGPRPGRHVAQNPEPCSPPAPFHSFPNKQPGLSPRARGGRSHPAQRDPVDVVTCSLTALWGGDSRVSSCCLLFASSLQDSNLLPSPAPPFLPASVSPEAGVVCRRVQGAMVRWALLEQRGDRGAPRAGPPELPLTPHMHQPMLTPRNPLASPGASPAPSYTDRYPSTEGGLSISQPREGSGGPHAS